MENEKITSELAFNAAGESFDLPDTAAGLRVRRMKPRGAPELMYGMDGRPLVLPIDATLEDLREAVGQVGRYRLDPVDDEGRIVVPAQAAYIQVAKTERTAETAVATAHVATTDDLLRDVLRLNAELARQVARPVTTATDDLLREVVQLNTGLAREVIERFSLVMESSALILRAADGAGLPARPPRAVEHEDVNKDTDDDDRADDEASVTSRSAGFDAVCTMVAKVTPTLVDLAAMKLGLKSFSNAPTPTAPKQTTKPTTPNTPAEAQVVATPADESQGATTASLDPSMMVKFIAIQSALTSDEAALARALAAELSPAERRDWLAELAPLSVSDAVAKVRSIINAAPTNDTTTTGGAS